MKCTLYSYKEWGPDKDRQIRLIMPHDHETSSDL